MTSPVMESKRPWENLKPHKRLRIVQISNAMINCHLNVRLRSYSLFAKFGALFSLRETRYNGYMHYSISTTATDSTLNTMVSNC